MTHWARNARNKKLAENRKAAKQGEQIVAWMRRNNGANREREDEIPGNGGMETAPTSDGQEGRE